MPEKSLMERIDDYVEGVPESLGNARLIGLIDDLINAYRAGVISLEESTKLNAKQAEEISALRAVQRYIDEMTAAGRRLIK